MSQAEALRAFTATPVPDPWGEATADTLAAAGPAFKLTTASGSVVFVLERNGDAVSIHGAAGQAGEDLTAIGLTVIEECARQAGAKEVKFQTARRGLVRKAEKAGYTVAGWILKKAV